MFFNALRRNRALKLAALFTFAAAGVTSRPTEDPQVTELRQLAQELDARGPFISPQRFDRFNELMQKMEGRPETGQILASAGFCAHGSGGGSNGPSGAVTGTVCPQQRRRRAAGDHSHLLVFHHWV